MRLALIDGHTPRDGTGKECRDAVVVGLCAWAVVVVVVCLLGIVMPLSSDGDVGGGDGACACVLV